MQTSPQHILILEPDAKLAAVFAEALRSRQYEVVTVTTAQDAVTAADEQQPDLVLLELQLVAHGGVEFLYEFRSYTDWREVPAIIVSHVPPKALAASRQLLYDRLGVREYLYKPQTNLQTLLTAVARTLEPVAA